MISSARRSAPALLFAVALLAQAAIVSGAPDPKRGHWSRGPALPIPRAEAYVGVAGGAIYLVGGSGQGAISSPLVQSLDPVHGVWRTRTPLPRGLDHIGVVGLNGKIYTVGGFTNGNKAAVADCYAFDSATDRWTAIAPLPHARGSVAVAALDGKIHAVGGRDTESVTEHDVYDPATNAWSAAAPLPPGEGRDHMGLLAEGGRLYAIAGRINDVDKPTDFLESYDPKTDRWNELPRMPSKRSGGAAAVYQGRLLYIGGELLNGINNGTFITNEAYDPRTQTWSELAPLPAGRHGFGAAVVGDKVYLPGGQVNAGGQLGWPNGYNERKYATDVFVFSQP